LSPLRSQRKVAPVLPPKGRVEVNNQVKQKEKKEMDNDELKAIADIKNEVAFQLGQNYELLDEDVKAKIDRSYDSVLIKALTIYNWGFATKHTKLLKYNSLESDKYSYYFEMPHDFLKMHGIYIDKGEALPIFDYELISKVLWTNNSDVYLKYTKTIKSKDLPQSFVDYFVYEICSKISYNFTGDEGNLLNIIEIKKAQSFQTARDIDGRQKKGYTFVMNPFVDCRD
jgi:hypothetical protein